MSKIPKGWSKHDDKLTLKFHCDNFMHAVSLVNSIAAIAETQQHHPDIALENYSELIITTTTHSVGRLTDKDYTLAQEISELINS